METFKVKIYIILLSFLSTICSCKEGKKNIVSTRKDDSIITIDTIYISDDLKKSSLDFIRKFNYNKRLIEVDIDKKEPNQIIITYICRGIADFEIKKFKPLFSYTIDDNLFFVYTGAEELLSIKFDSNKYTNYNFNICDDPKKISYIFEDYKLKEDTLGTFPEPFSSLPPPSLPPPVNKKKSSN